MKRLPAAAVLCLALAAGCSERTKPQPEVTAPLPAGDVERGKAAFNELRCWSCHEIYGGGMPGPTVKPVVPVYLGGNQRPAPPDAYLVRSLTDPSAHFTEGYARELIEKGGVSRMPDYSNTMTVRQLVDLVAFLKSRYTGKPQQ